MLLLFGFALLFVISYTFWFSWFSVVGSYDIGCMLRCVGGVIVCACFDWLVDNDCLCGFDAWLTFVGLLFVHWLFILLLFVLVVL